MAEFDKTSIEMGDGPIYLSINFTTYPEKREISDEDIDYITFFLVDHLNSLSHMSFFDSRVRERHIYPSKVGSGFRLEVIAVLDIEHVAIFELCELGEIFKDQATDLPDLELSNYNVVHEDFAAQHIQTGGG